MMVLFIIIIVGLLAIIYYLLHCLTRTDSLSDIGIKKCLYIAPSIKGGYGVFTSQFIPRDSIVEIARTLPINSQARKACKLLQLYDYNIDDKTTCISLGYGSMYNHNTDHNIDYFYTVDKMFYITNRDVLPDSELYVNYGPYYFKQNNVKEL